MSARSAILVLNHVDDRHLIDLHDAIKKECSQEHDVFLLSDRTRPSLAFARKAAGTQEFPLLPERPHRARLSGKTGSRIAQRRATQPETGQCRTPVLLFHASPRDYAHLWIVEYDVRYSGSWRQFFASFDDNAADLIGTSLIRYTDFPGWSHRRSFAIPNLSPNDGDRQRGFFPVCRISNNALACLHESYGQGWAGHMEALMPTALYGSGLRIEDIGGDGEFVEPNNINRYYTNHRLTNDLSPGTFVYRPTRTAAGAHPDKLWHPVKIEATFATRLVNRVWRELSR